MTINFMVILSSFIVLALIFIKTRDYTVTLTSFIIFFYCTGLQRYLLIEFGIANLDLILLLVLISIVLYRGSLYFIDKRILLLFYLVMLLILFYFVLGSINGDYSASVDFLGRGLKNLSLFILVSLILYRKREILHYPLILVGLFLSILIITEWLINSTYFLSQGTFYRANGLIGNPNQAGATISLFILFTLYISIKKREKKYILILIVEFAALMLTQSRSALIASFAAIATLLLFYWFKKRVYILFITIGTILVSKLPMIMELYPVYFDRLNTADDNGRIDALTVGLDMGLSSLFGVGIGNTTNNILNLSSHNFYVHILGEAGILIYFFIIPIMLYLIFFSLKELKGGFIFPLTAFLVFIIINGFFNHNILNQSFIYIFMSIYFLIYINEERRKVYAGSN